MNPHTRRNESPGNAAYQDLQAQLAALHAGRSN